MHSDIEPQPKIIDERQSLLAVYEQVCSRRQATDDSLWQGTVENHPLLAEAEAKHELSFLVVPTLVIAAYIALLDKYSDNPAENRRTIAVFIGVTVLGVVICWKERNRVERDDVWIQRFEEANMVVGSWGTSSLKRTQKHSEIMEGPSELRSHWLRRGSSGSIFVGIALVLVVFSV